MKLKSDGERNGDIFFNDNFSKLCRREYDFPWIRLQKFGVLGFTTRIRGTKWSLFIIFRDFDQRVDGRHGRRFAHDRRSARTILLHRRPVDQRGMENRRDVHNVRLYVRNI